MERADHYTETQRRVGGGGQRARGLCRLTTGVDKGRGGSTQVGLSKHLRVSHVYIATPCSLLLSSLCG